MWKTFTQKKPLGEPVLPLPAHSWRFTRGGRGFVDFLWQTAEEGQLEVIVHGDVRSQHVQIESLHVLRKDKQEIKVRRRNKHHVTITQPKMSTSKLVSMWLCLRASEFSLTFRFKARGVELGRDSRDTSLPRSRGVNSQALLEVQPLI